MIKLVAKVILKSIGQKLIKVGWIKREVDAYRFYQLQQVSMEKKQAHEELWASHIRNLGNSNAIRDAKTEKDNRLLVDYSGCRVSQRQVMPVYLDSTNWSVLK